jgi:hypothetical protein
MKQVWVVMLSGKDDRHHHHQPINVPTAGAQAFHMDYPQGERAITYHSGPVRIGGKTIVIWSIDKLTSENQMSTRKPRTCMRNLMKAEVATGVCNVTSGKK